MISDAASIAQDQRARERRNLLLAVLLLTLLAAGLRFLHLGAWSMWADEVATLRNSKDLADVRGYPIGYILIGIVTGWFGDSEFVARLVPAVVGVLSVPVIYWIGRSLFSHRAGVLAGILLSLSTFHIYYSQYARYYTLLMLFGLLAMWMAFEGIERNSRWRLALAVVLLALAILTHWTAFLLLAALGCYALWSLRRSPRSGKRGGRPSGLTWANVGILFGPFVIGALVARNQLLDVAKQWVGVEGFSFYRSGLAALKIADRLDVAVLICAGVGAWLLLRSRDHRTKWLLCYGVVPIILAVLFVGLAEGGSRFAFVALPPFIFLAAYLMDALIAAVRPQVGKVAWLLPALVALTMGAKAAQYHTVEMGQRPRWKEAVGYVLSRHSPGKSFRIMTNAPEVVRYYLTRIECDATPYSVDSMEERMKEGLRPKQSPVDFVMVEHVANVVPGPSELEWLAEHRLLEKRFPLKVRFLDYSISVYGEWRPSAAEPLL